MKTKKALAIALALTLSLGTLAACGNGDTTPSNDGSTISQTPAETQPSETVGSVGGTITVLVESGSNAEKTTNAVKEDFQNKTGITINLEPVPYSGIYDKLQADIISKNGVYDAVTLDIVWIPSLYSGLEPVDDIFSSEEWADYSESLVDGARIDGALYGVPSWANCKIMYYRTDLFENEEEKAAFQAEYGYELIPPANWEQFRDVANFFTRDTDGDGVIDIYGTSIPAKNGGDTAHSYLDFTCQAGISSLIVDENNNSTLGEKPHLDALQFLVDLKKDGGVPEGIFETAAVENIKMFSEGKLAFVYAWAGMYTQAVDPEQSKAYENVGVTHVAAGEGGYGAVPAPWYNSVLAASKNKEAAKEFVRYMHEHNDKYAVSNGIAARNSVLADPELNKTSPQLSVMMETLNQPQSLGRPKNDYWNEIRDALNIQIQAALMFEIEPKAALELAAEEIESILK